MADEKNPFSLPRPDQHVAIIGRTGSGKTQQGAWLLSESDFDRRPHIILDYKGDSLLNSIEGIEQSDISLPPPIAPGLYICHIRPGQDELIDNYLWQIWAQNNTCLYIDEAYMIDKYSHPYNALMTQGRSKNINVYNLTQRPSQCSRFCFSEASHVSLFKLLDKRDKKTAESFAPFDLNKELPKYHSYWYNVNDDRKFLMHPVPDRGIILERFKTRLEEIQKSKRVNRRFI